MWLLIEVDEIEDVGTNEIERHLVDKPTLTGFVWEKNWEYKCRGVPVHPATPQR